MAAPNYHNYTTVSGSYKQEQTFQTGSIVLHNTLIEPRADEPGLYNKAEVWDGGELTGTWGAFMKSGSATAIEATATFTIAGGVDIPMNAFKSQTFYEVGLSAVSGSVSNGGVYLFKRRRDIAAKERK